MAQKKVRLDVLLTERELAPSREMAKRLIMAGEVRVDGELRDKPGMKVRHDAALEVKQMPPFVSRGGEKLAGALDVFPVTVAGRVCADVGASTGGFTDCLLQNDAARVYAIDVGYGQIDYRLRSDERVIVMERTNARHVETLPEPVSLVVSDVSFISIRYLLPVIRGWLTDDAELVVLVKPQFEAGREAVGKGGVVRDSDVHERVLRDVLSAAQLEGYVVRGVTPSPLTGPAGNVEFLVWLALAPGPQPLDVDAAIRAAVAAVHGPAHDGDDPATA